jgi:hypothetical protein
MGDTKHITIHEIETMNTGLDKLMRVVSESDIDRIDEILENVENQLNFRLADPADDGVQYARVGSKWVPIQTTRSFFRGVYESVDEIKASINDAIAGDYALAGELGAREYYNWHPVRQEWITGGAQSLDADVIANLYDSFPGSKVNLMPAYVEKFNNQTGAPYIYGSNGRNETSMWGVSSDGTSTRLASYHDYDHLVGYELPTQNEHYANKEYVDLSIKELGSDSTKVDKTSTPWVIYATRDGGAQTSLLYNTTANGSTVPVRNADGNIYVNAVQSDPMQAASKAYVDSVVSGGGTTSGVLTTWVYTINSIIPSGTTAAMTTYKNESQIISFVSSYTIDGQIYIGDMSRTGLLGLSESRVYHTIDTANAYLHNDSGEDITKWTLKILYRR